MRKVLKLITFQTALVVILIVHIVPATVSAQSSTASACDTSNFFLGFPTWYKYLDVGPVVDSQGLVVDNCGIIGPVDDKGDIIWERAAGRVGLAVLEILTRLAGLIAVGYVVFGGFRYITSQGDPENAKSARQTIINALIGVVISMIATGTVAFIGSQFI